MTRIQRGSTPPLRPCLPLVGRPHLTESLLRGVCAFREQLDEFQVLRLQRRVGMFPRVWWEGDEEMAMAANRCADPETWIPHMFDGEFFRKQVCPSPWPSI